MGISHTMVNKNNARKRWGKKALWPGNLSRGGNTYLILAKSISDADVERPQLILVRRAFLTYGEIVGCSFLGDSSQFAREQH